MSPPLSAKGAKPGSVTPSASPGPVKASRLLPVPIRLLPSLVIMFVPPNKSKLISLLRLSEIIVLAMVISPPKGPLLTAIPPPLDASLRVMVLLVIAREPETLLIPPPLSELLPEMVLLLILSSPY